MLIRKLYFHAICLVIIIVLTRGVVAAVSSGATAKPSNDRAETSMVDKMPSTTVRIYDKSFKRRKLAMAFLDTLREHVSTHVTAHSDRGMAASVELHFIDVPFLADLDKATTGAIALRDESDSETCRIESPWAHLSFDPENAPFLQGILFWNERQVLRDQVRLSGDTVEGEGPAIPLAPDAFDQMAALYADEVLLRRGTVEAVSDRIPADVLWVFQNSWQSTRGPFQGIARGALRTTLERGLPGYAGIVNYLIDLCVNDALPSSSSLDLLDLPESLLETYTITSLR